MLRNQHIKQINCRSISTLLITIIALGCLKINRNTTIVYRNNNDITHQLTNSLADKNPRIYFITSAAFGSNPHTDILVLEQVIDGQVYTPIKRKEKASNIKNNLSLANYTIVTARCPIA